MKNKQLKNFPLVLLACLLHFFTFAQVTSQQYVSDMFRGTRIVNGHSVETLNEGEMEMIIGHRFGRLNGGFYELFGLDQANIRLGLDYGIKSWLTIGIGRSSLGKEFDGFVKIRLLQQGLESGSPVSVTAFSSIAYNSLRDNPERPLVLQNRLSYVYQLYVARKVNDFLSVQIIPTLAHYNLVEIATESNDKLALGLAGKYQISKNFALTTEYYLAMPRQLIEGRKNSLSVGFDINTGSHVFQLHFTNSAGMIENQYIGETTGDWLNGDIHFGFNMVRTFKLKGRRY